MPRAKRRARSSAIGVTKSDPAPRPFRGPLEWIGERLEPIGRWLGDIFGAVPVWVWPVIGIALVVAHHSLGCPPRRPRPSAHRRGRGSGRGQAGGSRGTRARRSRRRTSRRLRARGAFALPGGAAAPRPARRDRVPAIGHDGRSATRAWNRNDSSAWPGRSSTSRTAAGRQRRRTPTKPAPTGRSVLEESAPR